MTVIISQHLQVSRTNAKFYLKLVLVLRAKGGMVTAVDSLYCSHTLFWRPTENVVVMVTSCLQLMQEHIRMGG